MEGMLPPMVPPSPLRASAAALLVLAVAGPAAAQAPMPPAEREAALARVQDFAACLAAQHHAMARVTRLIAQARTQLARAGDAAARRDARRALEALIGRAGEVQRAARACLGSGDLPAPAPRVVERPPPPDPAADAVARAQGSIRVVERDARLRAGLRVVRGEQVDGQGRVRDGAVRGAVRAIAGPLARCHDAHVDRSSARAGELDLVFTVGASGRAERVAVERSGFHDARMDECVRRAGSQMRFRPGASGGRATFSYTLRFGR